MRLCNRAGRDGGGALAGYASYEQANPRPVMPWCSGTWLKTWARTSGKVPGWDITFADTVARQRLQQPVRAGHLPGELAEFEPAQAVQRMYPDGKLVSQGTGAVTWVTRWPGWPAPPVTSATPGRPHRRRPRRGKRRQLPHRAVHRSCTDKQADNDATDAVWTQTARVQSRTSSTSLYKRNVLTC